MRKRFKVGVTAVVAVGAIAAGSLVLVGPAQAQEGDLNCGDPGTFHNMPIEIGNDPHGLDADGDGVGCEDASVFGGGATTDTTAPSDPALDPTAEPAQPVRRQPTFTG